MIRRRPDRSAGKNAPDDTLCSYIKANKNEPGFFRACLRYYVEKVLLNLRYTIPAHKTFRAYNMYIAVMLQNWGHIAAPVFIDSSNSRYFFMSYLLKPAQTA